MLLDEVHLPVELQQPADRLLRQKLPSLQRLCAHACEGSIYVHTYVGSRAVSVVATQGAGGHPFRTPRAPTTPRTHTYLWVQQLVHLCGCVGVRWIDCMVVSPVERDCPTRYAWPAATHATPVDSSHTWTTHKIEQKKKAHSGGTHLAVRDGIVLWVVYVHRPAASCSSVPAASPSPRCALILLLPPSPSPSDRVSVCGRQEVQKAGEMGRQGRKNRTQGSSACATFTRLKTGLCDEMRCWGLGWGPLSI